MESIRKLSGPVLESQSKTNYLVIFLHGWGSDGNDLIQLGKVWNSQLPNATFLAPNAPEVCSENPSGRQWFDILNYNESDKFSDKEKAALDLSFASGVTPNQTSQKHFNNLDKFFSKEAIVDIVSVISMFGFLNRWNDTFGTELEKEPKSFVEKSLNPLGWE